MSEQRHHQATTHRLKGHADLLVQVDFVCEQGTEIAPRANALQYSRHLGIIDAIVRVNARCRTIAAPCRPWCTTSCLRL